MAATPRREPGPLEGHQHTLHQEPQVSYSNNEPENTRIWYIVENGQFSMCLMGFPPDQAAGFETDATDLGLALAFCGGGSEGGYPEGVPNFRKSTTRPSALDRRNHMAADAEAMRIRAQYTGRVPVLCTRHEHGGDILESPKSKYLIPGASSAHELTAALREDTSHGAAAPLHLYLRYSDLDVSIDPETTLAAIDAASGAADGFLHIWYSSLNAAQLSERRDQGGTPSTQGGSPFKQGGTPSAPPSTPVAAAAASTPSEAALQSPHGDRVPIGLSSAACTFLNPRGGRGGELRPELTPSLGGRVPAALFVAVILDVLAVGLLLA